MEKKLLILLLTLFVTSLSIAQVTVGQVDDFEDGSLQGWTEGCCSANEPTNELEGANNYLNNISTGGGGPGSRATMNNLTQWLGNYTTSGIKSISMQVRNNSAVTINLRVAFGQNSLSSSAAYWVSTVSVDVPAMSGWTTAVFPITEPYMSKSVDGDMSFTYTSVMQAPAIVKISSSATVSHKGDSVATNIDFDDITANDSFLSTKNQKLQSAFTISPNPGRDRLNLKMATAVNNSSLEVFDVLGKKIYADKINDISKSVDVSQWNTGVYLVRLTTDTGVQTKRFIKQ